MKKIQVLVVDDIYTNRLLLSELIKTLGHSSLQAENGKEAIELIRNHDIHLVLMDIEMPVMNGIETCQYIRKRLGKPKSLIPVVALTAHNPGMFFEDFGDAGFDEMLTKPYSLEKVIEIINNLT